VADAAFQWQMSSIPRNKRRASGVLCVAARHKKDAGAEVSRCCDCDRPVRGRRAGPREEPGTGRQGALLRAADSGRQMVGKPRGCAATPPRSRGWRMGWLLRPAGGSRRRRPVESSGQGDVACNRICGKIGARLVARSPEMALSPCGARIGRRPVDHGCFRSRPVDRSDRDGHGGGDYMLEVPGLLGRGNGFLAVARKGESRRRAGMNGYRFGRSGAMSDRGVVSLQSTGSRMAVPMGTAVRGDCRNFGLQR
jgi:hypothetical protein